VDKHEFQRRTKRFGLVIALIRGLPTDVVSRQVARQSVVGLIDEDEQLLRMVVASINTARGDSR